MLAILKVGLVFVFMVLLMKKKCPLGWAMLVGAVLVGMEFGLPPGEIVKGIALASISRTCLGLIAVLLSILILSRILKDTGQMDRLMNALKAKIKDSRITMASLPAVIGLLPMLGGALLSAPMAEEAGKGLNLSPTKKALINYWFRHLWEYSWPLYPGIVLASSLSGVELPRLALLQLPLTLAALLAGILFVFRGVKKEKNIKLDREENIGKNRGGFFLDLSPFLLVLFLVLVLKVHLALALMFSVFVALVINRPGWKEALNLIKRGFSLEMVITALGIMAFRGLLEQSGAMAGLTHSFKQYNIPPQVMLIALPFLIGIFTGITLGPVSIVFPILLPFFQGSPHHLSNVVLAFASAFFGVLFSPVHLCLILTKDYFKADMGSLYRALILPSSFVMLVAAGLFFLYR